MKDNKFLKVASFILGFLFCNNIIYIFNSSTFYFYLTSAFSLVLLVYIFIKNKEKVRKAILEIDKKFYLYIFICIFSLIPASFYFINNIDLLDSYFNGLICLIFIIIDYIVIISLKEYKKGIYKGIFCGFCVNLIYSYLQYIFYQSGSILTLSHIFPNDSFQVCGKFDVLYNAMNIGSTFKIYSYRAQGLFLETSYYIIFLIGSILLIISSDINRFLKVLLCALSIYIAIISNSGNLILLILVIIVYFLLYNIKFMKNYRIKKSKLLIFLILLILLPILIIAISNNEELTEYISSSISSANIKDTDNASRLESIKNGIELIYKYPFGIGYNMASKIYSYEFPNASQSYIFSTLLINQLELGLIGTLIYLELSIKNAMSLIRHGKDKEALALGVSLLFLFISQISNGLSYYKMQYIILILALCDIKINEIKEGCDNNVKS